MNTIKLVGFDEQFLKTIKDYKKMHLKPRECVVYTITFDDKKAGVIGFKIKENNHYFLKIGIHQDFRGRGIFDRALNLLVKQHKITKIYSTIANANIASVKAHKKVGFRSISKAREANLKQQGLLLKRNTRLVKHF